MPAAASGRRQRRDLLRGLLLVVVTDRRRCRGELVASCEAALCGGATAIALRDKDLPRAARRRLGRRLREVARRHDALLLVHADPALARDLDADGVHLPADRAGEVAAARRVVGPGRLVGVSTHSGEAVEGAGRAGADYVFLGPAWPTASHPGSRGMGRRDLLAAVRRARVRGTCCVLIGGVRPARVADLRLRSPFGLAAVDSLLGAEDPCGAAGALLRARLRGAAAALRPERADEAALVEAYLRRMRPVTGQRLGPGDDAVVLGEAAFSTDLTIEGVHYTRTAAARAVGWKAAARALSDLAAVGARPVGLMVGLALRRGTSRSRALAIGEGAAAAARACGARVLGGDTKETGGAETIAVTAVGSCGGRPPLPRSGARPGDALFVTGPLGGSIRGRHLRFRPRTAIGVALRERGLATACIDLSDGLAADLHRLCRASGVGVLLDRLRVPVHRDARSGGGRGFDHALFDGEDYELLFTASPERAAALERRGVAGRRAFRVGRIVDRAAGLLVHDAPAGPMGPSVVPLEDRGWVHLRKRR